MKKRESVSILKNTYLSCDKAGHVVQAGDRHHQFECVRKTLIVVIVELQLTLNTAQAASSTLTFAPYLLSQLERAPFSTTRYHYLREMHGSFYCPGAWNETSMVIAQRLARLRPPESVLPSLRSQVSGI